MLPLAVRGMSIWSSPRRSPDSALGSERDRLLPFDTEGDDRTDPGGAWSNRSLLSQKPT